MHFARVLCAVLSVSVLYANADCPYKAVINSVEPCGNKQSKFYELKPAYNVMLTGDNCDINVTGCVNFNKEVKSAKLGIWLLDYHLYGRGHPAMFTKFGWDLSHLPGNYVCSQCKWTAWKNNMQVSQGERPLCGFTLGNLKVNCPLKQGSKICAKRETMKNPFGSQAMMMGVGGTLKAKLECTSEGVTQCMMGEGKIVRK